MQCEDLGRLTEDFERDGFVNGGMVVGASELRELRAEVERFAEVQMRQQPVSGPTQMVTELRQDSADAPMPVFEEWGDDPVVKHYKMMRVWNCSPAFRDLTRNQSLLKLAAGLLNARTLQIWEDSVQFKPALHGGPVSWHQDGPYHSLFFPETRPVERILSAWIALDDADEESGCMWMVPGSHRWGNMEAHLQDSKNLRDRTEIDSIKPHSSLEASLWRDPVSCPVKAGEVHFHHAYTWHASPMNKSPRHRRSYTIFFMADGVTGVPEGLPTVFQADARG